MTNAPVTSKAACKLQASETARKPEPIKLASEGLPFRTRIARSIFWLAWSRGVLQVLAFATTLLVARILVPADYGVMALAGVWTGSVGMVAEMGLGAGIIQLRDLDKREIDTCFWLTMTLATVGFAALAASAPMIARWFAVPRLGDVLPVLALVLPLTACRVVSDSLLRKRLALDRVAQAEMIGGAVTLPVMLGCAFVGLGVWTLVVGSLLAPAVRSVATFAFAPWRPGLRIGGERFKEVLRFSLATLGVKIMWALREDSDVLVIGKITGQLTLGFYSMAKELALLPGTKISTVVNMLSSPMMAELQTNIDAMRTSFYRAVRLTAAIASPDVGRVCSRRQRGGLCAAWAKMVDFGPATSAALCLCGGARGRRVAAASSVRASSGKISIVVLPCTVDSDTDCRCYRRVLVRGARCSSVLDTGVFRGDGNHGQGGVGRNEG